MSKGQKIRGKVSVVTGASSGMGRAIAELFAREGSRVVIADVNEEGLNETLASIRENDGEAISVITDVSDKEQVKRMVETAVGEYGSLDILVNNAGIVEDNPVVEIDGEEWRRVLEVNLWGAFWGCKFAITHMLDQGGGAIINMASIASFVGGAEGVAYTTSKHALVGLTRQTAVDYGPEGVRVNAICPGAVDTGMISDDASPDSKRLSVPARRVGKPQDIAQLALFLASDDADFIHGESIVIDGGWLAQV